MHEEYLLRLQEFYLFTEYTHTNVFLSNYIITALFFLYLKNIFKEQIHTIIM